MEQVKKLERYRKDSIFYRDYPHVPEKYESVADHSWRMAMMLIVLEKKLSQPLNLAKALKMALIHDIPEIIAGDLNALGEDGTGKDSHTFREDKRLAKAAREDQAAQEIFSQLPDSEGAELLGLWQEYERQECFEAQVVNVLDKMEAQIQSLQYHGAHIYPAHFQFHLAHAERGMSKDPILKELMEQILAELKANYREFTSIS